MAKGQPRRRHIEAMLLMVGASLSVLATGVAAQETKSGDPTTQPAGQAPAVPVTQATSNPSSTDTGIGDIVVTAQRRSERLQTVPIAIDAFDSKALAQIGITGTKQLTQVTPGLNFTQSVFSPQPTIRGVGTRGVSAGDESIVPIYIDGVYQPFLAGADLQFNDIERIEVLKGPQGALLGRNATGGAINIITREPGSGTHGAASVSYGRFNEVIAKGFLSVGNDKIAGDVAAVYTRDDGYLHDFVQNLDFGGRNDFSVKAKLALHPTDTFELRFAGGYTRNRESTGEAYDALNGNTTARRVAGAQFGTGTDYRIALSYPPFNNFRQYSGSLTAILDLDKATITSITGYQDNFIEIKVDSDTSSADLLTTQYNQQNKSLYHEDYVTTNLDGRFNLTAGFVFFHAHDFYPFYAPLSGTALASFVNPQLYTNSFAWYAQGSYKVTDQITLLAAGRYTLEDKIDHTIFGTTTKTIANRSATFRKFTPSVTLQYTPSPDLNIYAKYGQAFKSGLFNASATTLPALAPVQPENVKQAELGFKARATQWLRVEASGYYTWYDGLQSPARDPITLSSFLQNAGGARIYGGELEVVVAPAPRLNLRAGLSALHGTYRNFPASQATIPATTVDPAVAAACVPGTGTPIGGNRTVICDVSGKSIIRTPFFTANVGGNYSIPLGTGQIELSGNVYFAGHSYWDTLDRIREPAYVLGNAELGWKPGAGSLRLAVWTDNVFDTRYSQTVTTSGNADSQVLARPRSFGVRANYDF